MRTTIRLDDGLLRDAKKIAAESGRTLTALIAEALREAIARARARPVRRRRPKLPTFSAKLRPAVDLDDNAALRDVMDGED